MPINNMISKYHSCMRKWHENKNIRRPESKQVHGDLALKIGVLIWVSFWNQSSLAMSASWQQNGQLTDVECSQWGWRFRALGPKCDSRLGAKQEWWMFVILSDTYWKDRECVRNPKPLEGGIWGGVALECTSIQYKACVVDESNVQYIHCFLPSCHSFMLQFWLQEMSTTLKSSNTNRHHRYLHI